MTPSVSHPAPGPDQLGRVHFVGVAGAGLSGIARLMLARGIPVSGSDAADAPVLATLRGLGATCFVGHHPDHLDAADTVVVSTAVPETNSELHGARERGLRVLSRAAALETLMRGHRVVAVSGTHGKTTTAAMLTVALRHAGVDPSFAIGSDLVQTGTNAHHGTAELFVVEADESDGAFLVYSPTVAVVTNVEADHLDRYGTEAAYAEAFVAFAQRVVPGGTLVVGVDDPGGARLARAAERQGVHTLTYGEGAQAQLRAEVQTSDADGSRFTVWHGGRWCGEAALGVPGRHFVSDAVAALGAGMACGLDIGTLAAGLSRFTGTKRRMEFKGDAGGVRVYDSYAHHPREIAGDLQAARSLAGQGRLVVAFQPHLTSRTRAFGPAMGEALGAADEVVVLGVYTAREEPDPAVTGEQVASHVPLPPGRVRFCPDQGRAPELLGSRARDGDLVLTLGAGDVTAVGPLLLSLLGRSDSGEEGHDG